MWLTLRRSLREDPDFFGAANELLQSTFRLLVVITGSAYFLWYLGRAGVAPGTFAQRFFPVTVLVVVTCGVSFWLADKGPVLAQLLWQAGIAGAIMLMTLLLGYPGIVSLYVLLPLMAVVTLGWPAGLFAEGLVAVGLWWLHSTYGETFLSASYLAVVLTGGAFGGVLGWAILRTMLTTVQWYLFSFSQAQAKIEEARAHRAEVLRLLRELDQANHRLERVNHMLVLARAEAEEARESRNRFALAVSHELRTPLNFILGFSELMVNSPGTYAPLDRWPEGLYDDIKEIYHSTTHLLRLVNDILDLGQIEAMRMQLFKEWVDIRGIVEDVVNMVRTEFSRKGLYLDVSVEGDLPKVFVDRTRIRQVLLNLVTNSLRLTEKGGVSIHVRKSQEELIVCVRDTGPGIAQEDIPKVFEEFRHVGEGSWRRREGAGLGIPISRHFVELHGGRMWLESTVGQGTAFYFSLPLPGARVREVSVGRHSREVDARSWRWREQKALRERVVLVLSPDPLAGEVLARYVDGYRVETVGDPDDLVDRIKQLLPVALIVDQALAGGEATEAALRARPYDLPVITCAFPGGTQDRTVLPQGVCDYLVKPVSRQKLWSLLEKLGDGPHRLLVVDDDPAMVRFIERAIQGTAGPRRQEDEYQVMVALTGREALEQARTKRPDLILLDLALPDISGWEVLAELRCDSETASIPVALVTAHDWPHRVTSAEMEALRVRMRRPLSRRELTAVLNCLLETVRPSYPEHLPAPVRSAGLSA